MRSYDEAFRALEDEKFGNGKRLQSTPRDDRRLTFVERTNEEPEWGEIHPWPKLDDAALYGLAGELVRAIEFETEADPAAILATTLSMFGNAAGPGAHVRVHDDLHPGRLFVAIVGATSTGGKGTSLAATKPFFRSADSDWFESCRKAGFGSGEGVIAELAGVHRSRDDEAPIERRVLVIEPEFSRLLTINSRDGSTSSPILRSAWDDGRLELRKAKARMVATDSHLTLLAHISPDELREKLGTIEIASGFANRVLFVLSRRARKLPTGGNVPPSLVGHFGSRLNEAMRFARGAGVMRRDEEAEAIWAELYYAEPDREGIVGAVCDRWQAQKLRLSVIYALLDTSTVIRKEHVVAAEAFWRYCVASAEHIWGRASGDGVVDRLLEELRAIYPAGMTSTEQSKIFGRHVREDRLRSARDQLQRRGLIRIERSDPSGGRPATVAFAVPSEKSERSEKTTDPPGLISPYSLNSHRNEAAAPQADAGAPPIDTTGSASSYRRSMDHAAEAVRW